MDLDFGLRPQVSQQLGSVDHRDDIKSLRAHPDRSEGPMVKIVVSKLMILFKRFLPYWMPRRDFYAVDLFILPPVSVWSR